MTTRDIAHSRMKIGVPSTQGKYARLFGWAAFLAAYGVVAVLVLMPRAFF